MDNDRFYVKTLTLENFRCFEKTELGPFDRHFNLIIGGNGVGKSSVLLALANLLRPLASLGGVLPSNRILDGRDIRAPHPEPFTAFSETVGPWKLSAELTWKTDDFVANVFHERQPSFGGQPTLRLATEAIPSSEFAEGFLSETLGARRELLLLYGSRRKFQGVSTAPAISPTNDRTLAYQDWLEAGSSSDALREWLKDQTLVALQSEQRARDAHSSLRAVRANRQLTLVQRAVRAAIDEATRIEFDGDSKDIIVEFKDRPVLTFARMSDGQRAMIGLVADIARRSCLLNAERFGAEALSETTGIVLIDEIDLHLHPKWQRQIVGALKHIFPKIQFFATTHSPQIIGQARPEEIVMLTPEGSQKRPMGSFGMDSNWVLECVMEADDRDPGIALQIKTLFAEIEDGHFDKARALIEELRKLIGDYAPDIVGAESYIWRVQRERDEAAE